MFNKMKFLLATICCMFVIGSAKAQFGGGAYTNDLTIVWDGVGPGYRPNTNFTFNAVKNGVTYSKVFTSPGVWAPPMVIGNNLIGNISFGHNWNPLIQTTYWNWFNNNMIIGVEHRHYYDTYNGKAWYVYDLKATATEWHRRIGE